MEKIGTIADFERHLEDRVLSPLRSTSRGFYILVGLLLIVIAWGAFAYLNQANNGLIVTGMRDRVMWGLYVALFVFFIGASMAGTLVSALLRITNANWRTPITRTAEVVTVAALAVAGLFIMLDVGRPDRLINMVVLARWESPLMWDMTGLTAYFTGSVIYLYAAAIPDMAYCREKLRGDVSGLKLWLYETLSIGWEDTPEQREHLSHGLNLMMVIIIPVAVMMHVVTSWIFAMTLREPWDSSMFGVYFVGGAVFSGTGIIIILMAVLRKVYRFEQFITISHFKYLGYLLATFAAIMFFFNVNEVVTHGYKMSGDISVYLEETLTGSMAPFYWGYLIGGVGLPMAIIAIPYTRTIAGIVVAAVLVNIGMFIERYLIVMGGLREPLNPYELPTYWPTWIEWSLMATGISLFILIITLVLKVLPSLAIVELIEHEAEEESTIHLWRPTGTTPLATEISSEVDS